MLSPDRLSELKKILPVSTPWTKWLDIHRDFIIELLKESGVADLSKEIGIPASTVYAWRRERLIHPTQASTNGVGILSTEQEVLPETDYTSFLGHVDSAIGLAKKLGLKLKIQIET